MKRGTEVKIKGLVKASVHNGKFGIVTKASTLGEGRRVGVKLSDGTVLAIKIENLESATTMKEFEENKLKQKEPSATAKKTASLYVEGNNSNITMLPKERTLKRENALLREFDGNPDPNVLVLYHHFTDRAFDCFNANEYNSQMLRYYDKLFSLKLIVPRKIGNNEYFLIGLQHSQHDKNTLCEVAFNCGRSFTGISMLIKKRCFACHKPGAMQCTKCLCACFCSLNDDGGICAKRNSIVRSDHDKLCQKIDLSNVVVEDECVQLLDL